VAAYSWDRFEWDNEDKKNGNVQHLRDHKIEPEEAEECFFHNYALARDDRRFDDVYVIDGRTNRGRRLRLVFQDKGNGIARIFTGWELPKKKRKL
jgi:uncharacterized DUF497 family protein